MRISNFLVRPGRIPRDGTGDTLLFVSERARIPWPLRISGLHQWRTASMSGRTDMCSEVTSVRRSSDTDAGTRSQWWSLNSPLHALQPATEHLDVRRKHPGCWPCHQRGSGYPKHGDHIAIHRSRELRGVFFQPSPKRLSHRPLQPVALHRAADPACNRNTYAQSPPPALMTENKKAHPLAFNSLA